MMFQVCIKYKIYTKKINFKDFLGTLKFLIIFLYFFIDASKKFRS
jgi:hypothetical protein